VLRVALTGGIATGKTLVAELFVQRGVPVVDADVAARVVVEPGSDGLAEVVAAFGSGVLDDEGHLDRSALRQRIFGDDEARQRLEAILHPRIRAWMGERLQTYAEAGYPWALAVIPLLVETGQQAQYDRVLVVDAPEAVQRERLRRRDGTSDEEANAILRRQASRAERLRHADDVLDNSGDNADHEALTRRVAELDTQFRARAAQPPSTAR